MPNIDIPKRVELDAEQRQKIVDMLKNILSRFKENKIVDSALEYSEIISNPDKLHAFIDLIDKNRPVVSAIMIDASGLPVADDKEVLHFGISFAQVCQMLVFTSAKKIMMASKDDAKLQLLSPYLAFSWQLPLLMAYNVYLPELHIRALREDLLELRDRKSIEEIGKIDVRNITSARDALGDKFSVMLRSHAGAINGVTMCKAEEIKFFMEIIGEDNIWQFFARDERYINYVRNAKKRLLRSIGSSLAYVNEGLFSIIDRMPIERQEIVIKGFYHQFGEEQTGELLGNNVFLKDVFKEVVEYLDMVTGDDELFTKTVILKFKALADFVKVWKQAMVLKKP